MTGIVRRIIKPCLILMARRLAVAALWLAPVFSLLAGDDLPEVVRTNYYQVTGHSTDALLSAMRAQRPFSQNAYTEWFINWQYEFQTRSNEWGLRSFAARLKVTYTLPQWTDEATAPTALRAEWERYLAATRRHEAGHAEIGRAAAKAMLKLAGTTNWQTATKAALGPRVDADCEKILKEFRARETAYDNQTDHGRTQGARLGPASVKR